MRPVRRRHALCGEKHARATLGELGGAAEAGEAGTDHDDVSGRHRRLPTAPEADRWRGCRARCRSPARPRSAGRPRRWAACRGNARRRSPAAPTLASGAPGARRPSASRCVERRGRPSACRRRPGTAPCQGGSSGGGRRARSRRARSRASASRRFVTSSHSHTSSASPPPLASCAASRSPSQYGLLPAGSGRASSAVRHGASTPSDRATASTTSRAMSRYVVSLPPTMLHMPPTPSRAAWSMTWWARLISRDASW